MWSVPAPGVLFIRDAPLARGVQTPTQNAVVLASPPSSVSPLRSSFCMITGVTVGFQPWLSFDCTATRSSHYLTGFYTTTRHISTTSPDSELLKRNKLSGHQTQLCVLIKCLSLSLSLRLPPFCWQWDGGVWDAPLNRQGTWDCFYLLSYRQWFCDFLIKLFIY